MTNRLRIYRWCPSGRLTCGGLETVTNKHSPSIASEPQLIEVSECACATDDGGDDVGNDDIESFTHIVTNSSPHSLAHSRPQGMPSHSGTANRRRSAISGSAPCGPLYVLQWAMFIVASYVLPGS
eukprot:GHVU01015203.1.p1 GENE.GHVU01015203.1~~GHVU01015203.1.p1  ORF type:complete len:125 (+),score=1.88 GHVU01015203.1:381-755(+)